MHPNLQQLIDSLETHLIGRKQEMKLLLIALLTEGHVLLESVPGTGKTYMVKKFSEAIDGTFKRIQFTPDLLPTDVTGIHFFHPKYQDFELRLGPIFGNVILADEINRATPRTQASLLEVMEEKQVTIDGQTHLVAQPFIVIATQNPVDAHQGTYQLPSAQLDRFLFKIALNYPSREEERVLIHRNTHPLSSQLEPLTHEQLTQYKQDIEQIEITRDVEDYLLDIVEASREHPDLTLGVSPRGTLALMKAAKAHAFLHSRSYVLPDDIKELAPYVLTHRVMLTVEASLQKTPTVVVRQLLQTVSVPVL
ncbi:AAA family ATPase [Mangrovibacillus cuniculi]|uniref:MoxR family ATPase n=1 Tax=Mangrovibacillus cuniculi TaxID=2593652 RepID=A0A7S8CE50_9BACI|nr:MoxR family ATPase [Mangrovibacillus cuniculi]QPC48252.1 MoxR family ATPase [Mangrovibacillus cuniculi]